MRSRMSLAGLALLGFALMGCDGKDPERLHRVGKKIAEKSRKFADDAELPRVTIEKKRGADQSRGPVVELPKSRD